MKLTRDGVTPELTRPDPETVLEGDPAHTTWNIEERGGLYAGLWHATVGEWTCSYTDQKYVHSLEGHSVLTDEAGVLVDLKAGDSWVIRPGFKGTWRVVGDTLKDYVILV